VEKIISKQSPFDLLFENYLMGDQKMNEFSGFGKPSFEILTEMVVFFSHTLPSFKTKMNKLLSYADFWLSESLDIRSVGPHIRQYLMDRFLRDMNRF
jgi:hypothetical protein